MKANWPVTKRVEACVRNASTKHALTVWLDRMTIFGCKMAVIRPYMAVLSSQTIHACFAVAFWAQASTSFATGQLEVHFRLFVGTLNVNESFHPAFHGLSQQSCFGAAHSETNRVKRWYMPVHSMNLLGMATILSATGLSKRAAETCGRFQRHIGLSCASVLKFRHLTL